MKKFYILILFILCFFYAVDINAEEKIENSSQKQNNIQIIKSSVTNIQGATDNIEVSSDSLQMLFFLRIP